MSYTLEMAHYGEERDLDLTAEEKRLADVAVIALAERGVPRELLRVVRKSDSYATVVAHGGEFDLDLIRFKFSPRARWASVSVIGDDRDAMADSPLFAAQKNKRQGFWKAAISEPTDVIGLADFSVKYYKLSLEHNPGNFTS